jgi:hypothetical protein
MAAVDGFEREHTTISMTTLRALSPRKGDAAVEGRRRNAMQNEKESQQRREDGGNRENDNDLPLINQAGSGVKISTGERRGHGTKTVYGGSIYASLPG